MRDMLSSHPGGAERCEKSPARHAFRFREKQSMRRSLHGPAVACTSTCLPMGLPMGLPASRNTRACTKDMTLRCVHEYSRYYVYYVRYWLLRYSSMSARCTVHGHIFVECALINYRLHYSCSYSTLYLHTIVRKKHYYSCIVITLMTDSTRRRAHSTAVT